MLTYGLYVVTTRLDDEVHAATVTWVTQASFNPRLVLVGLKRGTRIYEVVKESGRFALNIVGAGQQDLASAFFKFVEADTEAKKIGECAYEEGKSGIPLLLDTPAWIECRVLQEASELSDHAFFFAEVTGAGVRRPDLLPMALRDTPWSYGG